MKLTIATTALTALALISCGKGEGEDTASTGVAEDWTIMADKVGEGVFLSAWSNGDEVMMVGGGMAGDGPGVIAHYNPDASTICTETAVEDAAIWWIHGAEEGEWFAVGERGVVLHEVDGVRTREDVESDSTLYGVWQADNGDAWAVGGSVGDAENPKGSGEIWYRNAELGTWELWIDELPGTIFKVWNGWFVGNEVAYYIDPENPAEMEDRSFGEHKILTARGANESDVWAVGGSFSATVLHFAGDAWSEVDASVLNLPLNGVWTGPGEMVWVTGMSGSQGYYDPDLEEWTLPPYPLTMEHFHAVWKHNDEVLFMGGNMLAMGPDYYGTVGRYGQAQDPVSVSACE